MNATFLAVVMTVVFGGALVLGALGSEDPLMRLTCRAAVVSVVVVLAISSWVTPDRLRRLSNIAFVMMLVAFVAVVLMTRTYGGGALNGQVTPSGEHYLKEHGQRTLVSVRVYYAVAAAEMLMFVSWPVGIALGLRAGTIPAARKHADGWANVENAAQRGDEVRAGNENRGTRR